MSDKKKKKVLDYTPHWTKEKEKNKTKHFYIIYTDFSTFSTKDNLSVF